MKYKVLTRYAVSSVLKIGFITALLAALMLMGVDLFKQLDTYTRYGITGLNVLKLTLLYFPEAFLLGLGPSFLFSITYFLSQFHASNEYICILNSGIRYKKFLNPLIYTGLFITLIFFVLNEVVAIPCTNKKDALYKKLTYDSDDNNDNSNVAISDVQNGYLVYAEEYIDKKQTLYELTYIKKNDNGKLIVRSDAYKAVWNEDNSYWTLYDVYDYIPSDDGKSTTIKHSDIIEKYDLNLDPQLFKNLSTQVSRMSIKLAKDYVSKIKKLNPVQYAQMGTEFYKRVLSCLTPLVMIIISCCLNYKFKKNAMFFSLLCSICIAVVYYVIQMLTLMLADQGVILPILGMIIPFVCIVVITTILSLIVRN